MTLDDGTLQGPLAVRSAEYRLAPAIDSTIADDTVTELWARVYHPVPLAGAAPRPLLVFLHGNHATCGRPDPDLGIRIDDDITYTDNGTCPSGYVVAPSHDGYGYVASRLASWGYVVVSINANRGINGAWGEDDDIGLNLRRGRLVLRHLQQLARWNTVGTTPDSLGVDLRGRLDFSQVGLMGHSRGGEGMRAALAQLRDAGSPWPGRIGNGLTIRAIYEIAPVDGQTSRTLEANGIPWNVLLPSCDGDVSSLDGLRPFDRMLAKPNDPSKTPKSTFYVRGANHNFYNTEWQESDSGGCIGDTALFGQTGASVAQQETALRSMVAFFRGHVGTDRVPALAVLLNPDVRLPEFLSRVTPIERGYIDTVDPAVVRRLEEFNRGTGRNTYGYANTAFGIGIEHRGLFEHDPVQRIAAVNWDNRARPTGNGYPYLQVNWAAPGAGISFAGYRSLEFRISRQCQAPDYCYEPAALNPPGSLDLSVALVRANGTLTPSVAVSRYSPVRGLGGTDYGLHPILRTVRLPVSVFGVGTADRFRGLRFTFDRTGYGAINLGNVRLSKRRGVAPTGGGTAPAVATGTAAPRLAAADAPAVGPKVTAGNRIVSVGAGGAADAMAARAAAASDEVEIVLGTRRKLPVTDALPLLRVGELQVRRLKLVRQGQETMLTFVLTADELAAVPDGAEVVLQLSARERWSFGKLSKPSAE